MNWYAIRTAKGIKTALETLERWGCEILIPKEQWLVRKFSKRVILERRAYMEWAFVSVPPLVSLYDIRQLTGIFGFACFDDQPAVIPVHEIDIIKDMDAGGKFNHIPRNARTLTVAGKPLEAGMRVNVGAGPLIGRTGTVEFSNSVERACVQIDGGKRVRIRVWWLDVI